MTVSHTNEEVPEPTAAGRSQGDHTDWSSRTDGSTPLKSESGESTKAYGTDPLPVVVGCGSPARCVLFGKYELIRLLGRGGMGEVYLARHLQLDRFQAIKLIRNAHRNDSLYREVFRREAKVMAAFSHPNVATVHDFHVDADLICLILEYIDGVSLDRVIRPGTAMPLRWTAALVEQVGGAIQAAHDKNIVHRDLKPSNIMVVQPQIDTPPRFKVLDFGLAKILEETETQSLIEGFRGTPMYASPEQCRELPPQMASDLYSFGVILYQCLTGSTPFHGSTYTLIHHHVNTPPPPFSQANPDAARQIPLGIEELVTCCLAKDPRDRPSSARAIVERFQECLREFEETPLNRTSSVSRLSPATPDGAGSRGGDTPGPPVAGGRASHKTSPARPQVTARSLSPRSGERRTRSAAVPAPALGDTTGRKPPRFQWRPRIRLYLVVATLATAVIVLRRHPEWISSAGLLIGIPLVVLSATFPYATWEFLLSLFRSGRSTRS